MPWTCSPKSRPLSNRRGRGSVLLAADPGRVPRRRQSAPAGAVRADCRWLLGALMLLVVGCGPSVESSSDRGTLAPASYATRTQRRAFAGAPPVIPHPPLQAACTTCHAATAQPTPTLGIAPANPHLGDPREGSLANCRQCHLFAAVREEFVSNGFRGWHPDVTRGPRAYPGAPPVIPHSLGMRSNCLACHSGEGARPETKCSHPERSNCRQCHLTSQSRSTWPMGLPSLAKLNASADGRVESPAE
jgi:nitrate reductase cytochrome c-type subunit